MKAAHFYARFGITAAQFRNGVPSGEMGAREWQARLGLLMGRAKEGARRWVGVEVSIYETAGLFGSPSNVGGPTAEGRRNTSRVESRERSN
jgi:hypothetical protein